MQNFYPKGTKHRVTRIIAGTVLLATCTHAFGFIIRTPFNIVGTPKHHLIVRNALTPLKGIPDGLRSALEDASERPDLVLTGSPDQDHFMNKPWKDCVAAINGRLYGACTNLKGGRFEDTIHELGNAFHCAADFYAHSNWVEGLYTCTDVNPVDPLSTPASIEPGELPPCQNWKVEGGTNWTIQGINLNDPNFTPPSWWRNSGCASKDKPSNPNHEEAVYDATLETERQWNQFEEILYGLYPAEATNLLSRIGVSPSLNTANELPGALVQGTIFNLTWHTTAIDPGSKVRITLLRNGSPLGTVAEVPIWDRSYSWNVGEFAGGTADPLDENGYQVQFSSVNEPTKTWTSSAFMISGVSFTSPRIGTAWKLAEKQNVTWDVVGLPVRQRLTGPVFLELWANENKVGRITELPDYTTGSYTWTVGQFSTGVAPVGSAYRLRIGNGTGGAFSKTFTIGNAAPTPMPDLVVTAVSFTPSGEIHHNDAVSFQATVKNTGNLAMPSGVEARVTFSVSGNAMGYFTVKDLAPGATMTGTGNVKWAALFDGNLKPVKAVVDATSVIKESNESNNRLTRDLKVLPGLLAPPIKATGCGIIRPGYGLPSGTAMKSCDGRFELRMQTDGNLVLYMGTTPLWNSGTNGQAAIGAYMQTDGNLVIYMATGKPLWSSGSFGTGTRLEIQNDGNLVIYNGQNAALWNTQTSGH